MKTITVSIKQEHPKILPWFAFTLIVAGLALVMVFGPKAGHAFKQLHRPGPFQPQANVELIRGWMTVPHIARVYRVPENDLFAALKLNPAQNRAKSLDELNKTLFPEQPGSVLKEIKQTITLYHTSHRAPLGPKS